MDYLLKASGIVIILFLFYTLFLKNETFFKSIRGYFLIGLIIVVSIPLIEIPVYIETISNNLNILNYEVVSANNTTVKNTFDWLEILTLIYLIGVTIFSIKFLFQLTSLLFLLSKHQFSKKGNYYFIETSEEISPFSFFNIIIYNKAQFTSNELEQIINHEKAHVLQWHSLDTILAHLLVITLWFNPFVWLYKKAVQQNLEFLADSYAIQLAENQQLYQLTLLKTCRINYCTEITNNFYNSLIKKRIIMIHKNKSTNKKQWKYVLLLPILIAFVATFNTKLVAQEKKLIEINEMKIELIIDKNSTDADLDKESETFKKEANLNLTFKGVKRNSSNEITAIKIDVKGDNLKSKFENSGTEPIKPIRISYDSENKAISIGNVNRIHKNHYTYKINDEGDVKFKGKQHKKANYVFISSDGEKTSWTSKDSDTIVHKNKIIIKSNGDDENVWITEGDNNAKVKIIEIKDGKKVIKIIEDGETKEIEHEIEIINNGGEDAGNVFIIKKDGAEIIHEKSDDKVNFNTNNNKEPLFYVDGKEITKQEMEQLKPDSIKSMNVLKGESALKKYGKKGENGVIEIFMKE